MGASQLKRDLHEICQIVRPYRIAYELARGVRLLDVDRVSNSQGAGESPRLASPLSHQDHQSAGFEDDAGSPKAPSRKEENKK